MKVYKANLIRKIKTKIGNISVPFEKIVEVESLEKAYIYFTEYIYEVNRFWEGDNEFYLLVNIEEIELNKINKKTGEKNED
jgi:hypothetical protein